ncbi:MAG: hypothetical protein ACP5E5_11455 [Acidobacteriaceae bacterium]
MAITRIDRVVQTAQGQAIAGAQVYFLTQPANVETLTPLASVYSDTSGTPGSNPQQTDGLGQIGCYLENTELYTMVVQAPQIEQQVYPDQSLSGGAGTGVTPFGQTPAGAINGTNVTFTLTVAPATLLILQYNSAVLVEGVGYSTAVVNGVFTITLAVAPQPGDVLYAFGLL